MVALDMVVSRAEILDAAREEALSCYRTQKQE